MKNTNKIVNPHHFGNQIGFLFNPNLLDSLYMRKFANYLESFILIVSFIKIRNDNGFLLWLIYV